MLTMKCVLKHVLFLFLTSCVPDALNKELTYQNIVILSDLSSRMDNRPPKDLEEIEKIVQFFKSECVKPGEKIGDNSSMFFSSFSDKVAAKVDIGEIKNLGDKQRFINSTGDFQNAGLTQKLKEFRDKVEFVYSNTRNEGLDLISILMEKIENEPIIKEDRFFSDGIDTTFIKYENHIYVFTDGYLEYANKQANRQFYFGSTEINNIRKFCLENKVDIAKALYANPDFCLPAFKSQKNKRISLHIMETHERDKNLKLQTYKHPKGLRDNEILEAVWRKWAKDSGFKNLTWAKY
jgi:tetrahydromethanopterin S-methyltransferase subunit G